MKKRFKNRLVTLTLLFLYLQIMIYFLDYQVPEIWGFERIKWSGVIVVITASLLASFPTAIFVGEWIAGRDTTFKDAPQRLKYYLTGIFIGITSATIMYYPVHKFVVMRLEEFRTIQYMPLSWYIPTTVMPCVLISLFFIWAMPKAPESLMTSAMLTLGACAFGYLMIGGSLVLWYFMIMMPFAIFGNPFR
jgi:hypothetical protein